MSESITKKFNLPFKETELASDTGMNGVLVQEVLPDFSICPLGSKKVEVKGILRQDVKNNDLYSAVLAHLKGVPHANISFAQKALSRFYKEYTLLRENGMDCLLRAVKKSGMPFLFHEKFPEKSSQDFSFGAAYFNVGEKTLNFLCDKYVEDEEYDALVKKFVGIEASENLLAHEIGHFLMWKDSSNGKEFGDYIAESEFGVVWNAIIASETFLEQAISNEFRYRYETICKRKHYTDYFYSKLILAQQREMNEAYRQKSISYPRIKIVEAFTHLLGPIASSKEGMAFFDDVSKVPVECGKVHKIAIETILDLGKKYAASDLNGYIIMGKTIENFKFSSKIKKELKLLRDIGERQLTVANLQEFDSKLSNIKQLFCTETIQMRDKIKENLRVRKGSKEVLKVQSKGNECIKSILKVHSDFWKKVSQGNRQFSR